MVLIKRLDGDGETVEIAYSSKLISCYTEEEDSRYPYINLRVQTGDETPDGCYRVSKEPVGYMKDGQLESLIEKTWPLKKENNNVHKEIR